MYTARVWSYVSASVWLLSVHETDARKFESRAPEIFIIKKKKKRIADVYNGDGFVAETIPLGLGLSGTRVNDEPERIAHDFRTVRI